MRDGASPWKRGRILNTRTDWGQPLSALVLVNIPTFPGCLVETRVLGMAEFTHGDGRHYLMLGVPQVDPQLKHIEDVSRLSRHLRNAAENWVPGFQRWLGVEGAATVLRQATEKYWREKAKAESGVRSGAAWKVPAPPTGAGERGEAEPHTWAEYLIPSLPMRFQRHVEEMLLPEERVLFFAERPEFAPPGRLALFHSQKLRQGLLVITNRQVLTMLDSLPPDSAMVDWGFIAKATAIERIESAWSERRDSAVEFNMAICAQGGTERYSLLFPGEHEEVLQEGVHRITLRYDYPDSPAFVHAFLTLRHLLGRPVTSGTTR